MRPRWLDPLGWTLFGLICLVYLVATLGRRD